MIKSLKVSGFKSLQETSITIKPLTLLVGQNSVGKSSVFQAILAISQWVSSGAKTVFPLNGDVVKLGTFKDVLTSRFNSSKPDDRDVKLEIELGSARMRMILSSHSTASAASISTWQFETPDASLNLSMGQEAKLSALFKEQSVYQLDGPMGYEGSSIDYAPNSLEIFIKNLSKFQHFSMLSDLLNIPGHTIKESVLDLIAEQIELFDGLREFYEKQGNKVRLVSIYDFLDHVLGANDAEIDDLRGPGSDEESESIHIVWRLKAKLVIYASAYGGRRYWRGFQLESFVPKFPDLEGYKEVRAGSRNQLNISGITQIQQFLRDRGLFELQPGDFDSEASKLSELDFGVLSFETSIKDHSDWILDQIQSSYYDDDYRIGELRAPADELEASLRIFGRQFNNEVSYLGPLRADGFSMSLEGNLPERNSPVGKDGSNTALLIQRLIESNVAGEYPLPGEDDLVECSFKEALEAWFSLFTVDGGRLRVLDQGKFGLQVEFSGRTLDRFGTGASQVLPILVLVLSSQPGTTLLIEQPELHLHPGGQQYLADFFMAAASMEINVVIETHSEYIVNRIRRGVVLGQIDHNLVQLVNFERDDEGLADVTSVSVTESGGFADWPKGFFAQTEDDLLDIIMALESEENPEKD
jgi:predicted ATPase